MKIDIIIVIEQTTYSIDSNINKFIIEINAFDENILNENFLNIKIDIIIDFHCILQF